MADEKKLTNEQLDEVAGGIGGNVTQAGVAGVQSVIDQSATVVDASTTILDASTTIDDVTQVKAGILDNSWNQQQVGGQNNEMLQ